MILAKQMGNFYSSIILKISSKKPARQAAGSPVLKEKGCSLQNSLCQALGKVPYVARSGQLANQTTIDLLVFGEWVG